jgi:hypothetical protein
MSCCSTPTPRRVLRAATVATLFATVFVFGARLSGQTAPQSVSPFEIIGFIQKATLDTPGDVLSGGSMTINGHVITVPRNTILQMPAAALTWQEVFALAPAVWKNTGASGLALQDRGTTGTPPLATYEVHVQGNRIVDATGDHYIAGQIFISQQSLNVGQGYINYIDYAKGEMRVGGVLKDPTTGARIRINDRRGQSDGQNRDRLSDVPAAAESRRSLLSSAEPAADRAAGVRLGDRRQPVLVRARRQQRAGGDEVRLQHLHGASVGWSCRLAAARAVRGW